MEQAKDIVELVDGIISIIQSLVLILATIVGAIWAYYRFGYEDRIKELRVIKEALERMRGALNNYQFFELISSSGEPLERMGRDVQLSQDAVRFAFSTAFHVDTVKRVLWQGSISEFLSWPLKQENYDSQRERLNTAVIKLEVEIDKEAQKHMRVFRRIINKFRS